MFRTFEHFDEVRLAQLSAVCRHENLSDGQILFAEGDPGRDFFLLLSGLVEEQRATPLGPQTIARLRIGAPFGVSSFVDGGARACTAIARGAGVAVVVAGEELSARMAASPPLRIAVLRLVWHALAAKLRQANLLMADIAAVSREVPERRESVRGETVELQPSAKLEVFSERGLDSAQLRLLATTLPAERFAAESVIFSEGDPGSCLYLVVDGQVRVSRRLPGLGEEALAILGRGELFGEMALVDELPRSADARAHTGGCTLLRVERADVGDLLGLPAAAAPFLTLLCSALARRFRAQAALLASWKVMAGFG